MTKLYLDHVSLHENDIYDNDDASRRQTPSNLMLIILMNFLFFPFFPLFFSSNFAATPTSVFAFMFIFPFFSSLSGVLEANTYASATSSMIPYETHDDSMTYACCARCFGGLKMYHKFSALLQTCMLI